MGNRRSNPTNRTARRAKKAKSAMRAGKNPEKGAARRTGKSARRTTTRKRTVPNSGVLD